MNLHEAISIYRLQLEANGRSEHTIAQAERHLKRFREWLGDGNTADDTPGAGRDVETIDATLVARFFVSDAAKLGANGAMKKPTSMNAMRSSLRAFFRFLHDAGHVRHDPTRLVRRARCAVAPPRGLTDDELRRLLNALAAANDPAGERDRLLFLLLLKTGSRIGTALGIDAHDVNLETGEIDLRVMKGNRPARIVAPEDVVHLLRRALQSVASGPIFRGRNTRRMDRRHASRRFRLWLERAEIARRTGPHALRHSYALTLYRDSGDLFLVSRRLHHASILSTMPYLRSCDTATASPFG